MVSYLMFAYVLTIQGASGDQGPAGPSGPSGAKVRVLH